MTILAMTATVWLTWTLAPTGPVNAIDGIIAAFETHRIVTLPDAHGDAQRHAFLLSLVRDPRFVRTVDDIVVEFGNSRYQDVVDRFVRGEDVPYESLRLAWRNVTQASLAADSSHHEEFFRAVRAANTANESSPGGRKVRVLLGDPPIDWDAIQTREDYTPWIDMRDAHPAAMLQTEVIAKRRRALLVYGTGHLQRKQVMSNFEMEDWRAQTIVSLVERAGPTKVFTIASADRKHADGWTPPALFYLRGTPLGTLDVTEFFGGFGRFTVRDGKMVPVPKVQWRTLRAEEQFDALLYLGPPSVATSPEPFSTALCAEPGYVDMRLRRLALAHLPPSETERLKKLCGD
jgi:hypothetical protein